MSQLAFAPKPHREVAPANVGETVVILAPPEFIDNAHIDNPCTRAQFATRTHNPRSAPR